MNLAKIAIDNSRVTVLGMLIILALGVSTYLSYPRAEDPSITIRSAGVDARFPGMAPERVEELIAKPIEAAMREIAEIDDIDTIAKTGEVEITLTIRDDVQNLEAVFQDIRNKADDVASDLPDGTQGPFVNDEEGLTAVATIALWADGFSLSEMRDVARDARDRIYTLDGIRKVQILGEQPERIYMEGDITELSQLGLNPQEVFGALAQQNIIEPGGSISADGRTVLLEPSGNLESVDEIRDVVFRIPDTDRVLRFDEIVDIRRALVDPPQFPAYFNDHPAIILSVSTVDGVNNVEFGQRLTALIDDIEQELPIGYVLDYATYQPELIAAAVDGALSNVYQTLAIVLAVVMVFLGLRTGLIVGFFVPLTMLLGVVVMLALRCRAAAHVDRRDHHRPRPLVDNGIVVAEDIRVRMERGVDRFTAAAEAGASLAVPLLTSSLTTIFAFLPMMLVEARLASLSGRSPRSWRSFCLGLGSCR